MTGLANRSESRTADDQTSEPEVGREPTSAGPRWWILLPLFLVLAVAMTFPSLGKLNTHVVGNSGDSLLILWILGWVQHAIPHGWGAVWDTSMFHPAGDTLAYSDSLISVALVQWPLRLIFGPELSLNIIAIAAQTATLWFMYRLALVLTRSWTAALVAALMFGFSMPLMSQLGHYQLMLTAWLVPLGLLLLVRYLETFRIGWGVGVGLVFAALTTSATYYGLMMAVGVGVVVVGYLIWFRPHALWTALRGLVIGGAVAAVITLPLAVHYTDLQKDDYFRRGFEPALAAHVGDFFSPDGASYVLDEIPVLGSHAVDRGVENHLYPGLFTVAFAAVGVFVVVRGLRRRATGSDPADDDEASVPPDASPDRPRSPATGTQWASRITILICLGGLGAVVLAFGDQVHLLGHSVWMPMKAFRKVVPGFSGIRATSRFVILGQCGLALLAAFGVRALTNRLHRTATVAVVIVLLCGLVLVESARAVPFVDVPDGRVAEGVGRFLESRPEGVVAELPIRGTTDGPFWAYTESPRLFVSLIDANERINGYSGYSPPGFDEQTTVYNAFPSPESLALLDKNDVRYVVLRTKVIGQQFPEIGAVLDQDGEGRFTTATAKAKIAAIPPERVKRVTKVPGAYVVELRRP